MELNNRTNLNPDLRNIKNGMDEFYPTPNQYFPTAEDLDSAKKVEDWKKESFPVKDDSEEERKRQRISSWNNKPEVKESGIEAIDKDNTLPVPKRKFQLMKILTIVGIVSLIGILLIGAVFAYLAWDGKLKDATSLVCGNTNVTVVPAEINLQPTNCGDCNCPNLSCPADNIRLYCRNETN
jgi:hypothetical protein